MGLNNSIKNKLFFLLVVMGAIPFIIVIIVSSFNMISEWEKSVERNGALRNTIISEHVTELFERNFYVMHTAAINSLIVNYVENPQPANQSGVLFYMKNINGLFQDENLMGLTAMTGVQLIRTDGEKLVDISTRKHFQEAMLGHDFVSDVILSMSTGKLIVVLTIPVKDSENNIVGVLQRNFNLSAFQSFVESQDDGEVSVIILDRNGRIIANSDDGKDLSENFSRENAYRFISNQTVQDSGIVRTKINGEDVLISYSQNNLTDWTVITVQPYKYILDQVYSEIVKYASIGLFMLLVVSGVAYFTSVRATRPIIEITKAANRIAGGSLNVDAIQIQTQDEFGEMATAFNKMRKARDNFKMESQIDKLTKLFNKATFENVCNMKLRDFSDSKSSEDLIALYIIDLDHFKEVNDTKGHQFGDRVLEEFSKHLRGCFRPYDCVARFGGDEFLVVIDHMPNTEVITRKAEMINHVARNLEIDGENAKVTASVGIAIVPRAGTEYEEIFKSADKSLYFVKNNGRDGWHCDNL